MLFRSRLDGRDQRLQALRLEYYELFSRVFVTQGRPFRPWHLRVEPGAPLPLGRGSLNGKEGG